MAMERLTFMDNIRTIFPLETALDIPSGKLTKTPFLIGNQLSMSIFNGKL